MSPQPVAAQEQPARFSTASPGTELPGGWRRLELPRVERPTAWHLVEDEGRVVLRGTAERGASLVYSPVEIGAAATPIVRWNWKVSSSIAASDLSTRKGDDAAARVYIAFEWDPKLDGPWQKMVGPWQRFKYRLARKRLGDMPPFAAITYVWAHREPVGWRSPNPSFERSVQIVLRSGEDPVGHWVDEERDVRADFMSWFGFEPPPISHVAVMVDTDDTGGETETWFGDLEFGSKNEPPDEPGVRVGVE